MSLDDEVTSVSAIREAVACSGIPDLIEQVELFHKKFVPEKVATNSVTPAIEEAELRFRIEFLKEELDELERALESGDRAGELDAYVDICWVAIGSALMRFGPAALDLACNEVARANFSKVRIPDNFKIQKPEGWVGPDIQGCIDATAN